MASVEDVAKDDELEVEESEEEPLAPVEEVEPVLLDC